jgi:chromosome segregation ATPase
MKQDKTGSVVVTQEGERLVHPEGVPADNIGEPECTDWQEKAFELAAELEQIAEKLRVSELERDYARRTRQEFAEQVKAARERYDRLQKQYEELCRQKANARSLQRHLANAWHRLQAAWKRLKKWLSEPF